MVAICDLRSVSLIVPTLLQATHLRDALANCYLRFLSLIVPTPLQATQLRDALARAYNIAAFLDSFSVNEFVCSISLFSSLSPNVQFLAHQHAPRQCPMYCQRPKQYS